MNLTFAEQNRLFWPQFCESTAEFAEKITSTTTTEFAKFAVISLPCLMFFAFAEMLTS